MITLNKINCNFMMEYVELFVKNLKIIFPCDKIDTVLYTCQQHENIGSLIYTSNKKVEEFELLKLISDINNIEHVRDIYKVNDFILNFSFYPTINLLNKVSGSINKFMYTIDNYAVKQVSKKTDKITNKKQMVSELYNNIINNFGGHVLKVYGVSNIVDFYAPLKIITDSLNIIEYEHIWLDKLINFDDIIDIKFKTYIGKDSYKNKYMIDNFIRFDNFNNKFDSSNTLSDIISLIKKFIGDDMPNFIIFMKDLLKNYSKLNNYTSVGFSVFILKNNNSFKYIMSDFTITGNKLYMENCIKRFINLL